MCLPPREQGASGGVDITGSIYVIPHLSTAASCTTTTVTADNIVPQRERTTPHLAAAVERGTSALLLGAAQASQHFASGTALTPGLHVMCHIDSPTGAVQPAAPLTFQTAPDGSGPEDDSKKTPAPTTATGALWAFREAIKAGTGGAAVESARLAWQNSCRQVLTQAVRSLGLEEIAAAVDQMPEVGWGLVSCTPDGNAACSIARGGHGRGGELAWFHRPLEESNPEAETAIVDSLLLTTRGSAKQTGLLQSAWYVLRLCCSAARV